MLRIDNMWTKYFFIAILFLYNNLNIAQIKSILPSEIQWKQLLAKGTDILFLGGKDKELVVYSNLEKKNICSIKNGNAYAIIGSNTEIVAFHQKSEGDSNYYTEIDIYNYKGVKLKNIKIPNVQLVCDATYSEILKEFVFAHINIEDYYKGVLEDGITTVKVNSFNGTKLNVSKKCKQDPPPNSINLPLITVSDKIFLCFKNQYLIDVYSKKGIKLFELSNNNYKHKPYSKKEISCLDGMERAYAVENQNYPSILQKLCIPDKRTVMVFRKIRPCTEVLYADFFSSDNGKFLETRHYKLNWKDKIIDIIVANKFIYVLTKNRESNEYVLNKFTL
ncbi:MAG: hypothetical protein COW71_09835 [Ignavibacteriales bacterium CG18_big_fil_WC_8_21_14_2_50_31_20]|nr:MAG: hypothetical protein COW71_09835 [Ignavibacteriales bacterium CG18_big_fil_WC_8_21_14_2_50_31_20]